MIQETIQICNQGVELLYCAAAEIGFEALSGKSSDVFIPKKDAEGKFLPPPATTQDYIYLALSAIVAAYDFRKEAQPITTEDILYKATPAEITTLITTVIRLRNEWYRVPTVVTPETEDDGKEESSKNA